MDHLTDDSINKDKVKLQRAVKGISDNLKEWDTNPQLIPDIISTRFKAALRYR